MAALAVLCLTGPARPFEALDFLTPGASDDLRGQLRATSLLVLANKEKTVAPQDLFAAAQADYGRLIGALYAQGHYSPIIRIQIDGREAASIELLDAPSRIDRITVTVTPGPKFRFSRADIAPLAPQTELPADYAPGQTARSGAIVDAAAAGVLGWRQEGHAKARVADQSITADHRDATIAAGIGLDPGPRVRFGTLGISGQQRMRPAAIERIAGFPTGEVYDPDAMDKSATRLRRSGVFSSVALTEAERLGPGNTLDVALVVDEQPLRRLGFGAEISSSEGLGLTAFWLHRNLGGGGERLRIDGDIGGIGAQTGDIDYALGVRLDRPATVGPDTTGFVTARVERLVEEDYTADNLSFGLGFTRILGDNLTVEAGIGYLYSAVQETGGDSTFRLIELPLSAVWDSRDTALDATEGLYLDAEVKPFVGFKGTGSGGRIWADGRAYKAFGPEAGLVLAGRLQFGTILGSAIEDTPRDFLFYSGGGGTVRGQPYQSLGVDVLNGGATGSGGRSFIGLSGEVRADVSPTIGLVAFYDAGFVGAGDLLSDLDMHSGAGIGLRYNTGIGPIRLDVATPVSGDTGDGVQIYVGIGQAF